MKTVLLSTAIVMAIGGVASAQHCNGFGGYRGHGFGGHRGYARAYEPAFAHYDSFRIPASRLPANVVFKAIATEDGVVIVAVPAGSSGSTTAPNAGVPSGPSNGIPASIAPANPVAPAVTPQPDSVPQNPPPPNPAPAVTPAVNPQPEVVPQAQPVVNRQPQVTPASSVVQAPTGPSSPFFNIPEQSIPSPAFNGNPFFRPGPTQVVQNGGVRFNQVQNGASRAPNVVNSGAVRAPQGIVPGAAARPPVNNGATRQFQFNAPPPRNGRSRGR